MITEIHVNNLNESAKFYQEILDFEEIKSFSPQPKVNIICLKNKDNSIIELIDKESKPKTTDNNHSIVSLGFQVENLDETLKTVENNNVEIIRGPIEFPSGVKIAFIKDPNGVEIEFIENFEL